jgi:hypothetical protein
MEKKLTNSGPLREPADKHSIYPHRNRVRQIATELAQASLYDPDNIDLLKNLAVLFQFTNDTQRAQLAQRLVDSIR